MPPHIVLVCKVVLAVTLCSSSGKLGLTPQQAVDILTAGAPATLEVERTAQLPNAWHASTPYVRRETAPAVAQTQSTTVNVTVNVTQQRSYLDELRAQGALVYQIPRPIISRRR